MFFVIVSSQLLHANMHSYGVSELPLENPVLCASKNPGWIVNLDDVLVYITGYTYYVHCSDECLA